jgi:hypothetical protein
MQRLTPTDLTLDTTRRDLARGLLALFDHWELSNHQRMEILSLSPGQRKALNQYRCGQRALPFTRDALDRAGLLLGIYHRLGDLFPEDQVLRLTWIRRRNRLLGQSSPLDVMMSDGLVGVFRIARLVESQVAGQ